MMEKMPEGSEDYLGDGVYARFDGVYIWLWTSDGIHESKRIALEPEVYNRLVDFAANHWNMAKNGKVER